ncbi:MAG: ribonuclease Y [Bacilli bacterium]|nr:ribonuclease Y [Bacilli bacterium]MDD3896134.1 ribonuclease Y [Bacilli bacterium]
MVFNTASILTLFIGLILGGTAIYAIIILTGAGAGKKAEKMINDAKKEAEKHRRDSIIELKEESFKLKQQTDKEIKEKKSEILSSEERLMQREKSLDKREEMLHNRDNLLEQKDNNLNILQKQLQEKELKMDELIREEIDKLEQISNLSKEKAHDLIMERVESAMAVEIASFIKDKEAEATLEVDKKAKNLLVNSMERYANDVTTIQTVSTIELPNDEMKGRLIGREGRNIRTIEAVTGVDLIIDDTPEVIVISSFDPFRREIAKVTIETLIKDGRIHPTRIEEIYDKVCRDMNTRVTEIGNETIYELGLSKIDPELVYLIGKLNFRTSYGQNALNHSKEVANLAGLLASEIGENINLAKRAGLLHDIGKSIDNEIEGSHIEIGVDLAKKYGENDIVQNAILSHHGDHEATNIISVLISIADTLSAARPGARNDTMENYIKRLEELENLGNSFDGVEKTYAMQAGREVRIIVKPDEIDDLMSFKIAREMKEKIESEMQYPGTIKITVIRETRAQEEAK